MNKINNYFLLSLVFVLIFCFSRIANATIYQPGDTLEPDCAPGSLNCGVAVFSLNGQDNSTQTLVVGSSGNDFSISSVDDVHTFNLPSASSLARGLLSASDWSAFNNKEVSLTFGSGLTRTVNNVSNNLITGVTGGQTIIGGTAVGDGLIYKSTTGAGTATGTAHQFVGGTNGGTIAMTLLNNGNVGIGTTTPASKLEVNGDISVATAGNKIKLDPTYAWIEGTSASGGGYVINFFNRYSAVTPQVSISNSQLKLIGASVGLLLANSSLISDSAIDMSFNPANGGVSLTLLKTGNVGIGTATPTSKLEVVGSASFSSTVSGATSYNGLVITPNTGVITTGTWSGTTIAVNRGGTGTTNGSITGTGALSFTSSGINALTLDSGTTGNINIGINSNSKNIFIGNTVGTTAVQLNAGSGGVFVNGAGAAIAGNVVVCIDANNQLFLGATDATCNPSSIRYKHDITDITLGLDTIKSLRPVSFIYNSNNEAALGFIAEEVAQLDERLVKRDTKGIIQAVNPNAFTPILTHAIQQVALLLGDISPKVNVDGSDNGLSTLIDTIQTENARDSVAIITSKISDSKQFFTDFVSARVTAIRGYFDEIFTKKVHTEQLCIKKSDGSEICISGDELDALLDNANFEIETESTESSIISPETTSVEISPINENIVEEIPTEEILIEETPVLESILIEN